MYMLRVFSLCFVVGVAVAPVPADAQGPGANLATRVAALEAAVAALQGNIDAEAAARAAADTTLQGNIDAEAAARVAADTTLQGNIDAEAAARAAADTTLQGQIEKLNGNIVPGDLVGTYAVHFVATAFDGPPNRLTSYAITGTVTLAADNTGSATLNAAGIALTEGLPSQNWAQEEGGAVIECDFTWSYSDGTLSQVSGNGFCNDSYSVTAGGKVMVYSQGGAPGNNQLLVLWTRK